jgi:exopolysaccharide production protein ExoZ
MQGVTSIRSLCCGSTSRGIAVLGVVVFHFTNFRVGRAGVDLFFCISGFVMAGQMSRTPAQFAYDRFTRIYPPFVAAMALLFLVHPVVPESGRLIRSLLLVPDYHAVYLYPAWSLGYEAMFYAACVASMLVRGRWIVLAYAAAFALSIPYAGSAFVLEFFAGFCIARRRWWVLPLLFAASVGDSRVLSYGPPAALLLWASISAEQRFRDVAWEPLVLIGDASYSIYLTHAVVGDVTERFLPVFAGLSTCVAFGLLFHLTIEKPLVRAVRVRRRRETVEERPSRIESIAPHGLP